MYWKSDYPGRYHRTRTEKRKSITPSDPFEKTPLLDGLFSFKIWYLNLPINGWEIAFFSPLSSSWLPARCNLYWNLDVFPTNNFTIRYLNLAHIQDGREIIISNLIEVLCILYTGWLPSFEQKHSQDSIFVRKNKFVRVI